MNELSLYSGSGGGLLGTILLGWNPIGYVEINKYRQQVLAQRIRDGYLPIAPIYGDVRAFIDQGYANIYTGLVDVITGGFPCQPFSIAGKRKAGDDARNMWPATIECIRIIRPKYCFLENVRGLLSSGYFPTILKDLAESGYDARWRVLSASEVGAPHKRDRLWILAYPNSSGCHWRKNNQGQVQTKRNGTIQDGKDVADPISERLEKRKGVEGDNGEKFTTSKRSYSEYESSKWWAIEPNVGRVANGVAARVDRLKALGDGQVPYVVATAWKLLTEELDV